MSVCKLWNVLAQELLYENVWLTDARRWASLSAALQRPDVARHVRSLRLSTARYDHNVEALCYCPQVEMLYQPDYPRPEYLDTAPDVHAAATTVPQIPLLGRVGVVLRAP